MIRMCTASGQVINILSPESWEMNIEDVATSLGNQCRYNGNTPKFYSVAEHSVFCSEICPPEIALECLLHDAIEMFVGDITFPIKQGLKIYEQEWMKFEADLMHVVADNFGIQVPLPDDVHYYDRMMAAIEANQVAPPNTKVSKKFPSLPRVNLRCWSPSVARHQFLRRYWEIIDCQNTSNSQTERLATI